MKYNINHQLKVIIFWAPKSGSMSLIKLMTFLKLGDHIPAQKLFKLSNRPLLSMYRNEIFEPMDRTVDYKPFKKIFFGRNPFHRIISTYIDKYVNPISTTPNEVPDCRSFIDFLHILRNTGLKKERMAGRIKFGDFCSVKDDLGWQTYSYLGSPDFDMISLLPGTGIPEGQLTHDFRNIQTLLEILSVKPKYQSVQKFYENHAFSYDTWLQYEPHTLIKRNELALLPKEELWRFIKQEGRRTISYSSFYPSEIAALFREVYRSEFDFYSERGFTFEP